MFYFADLGWDSWVIHPLSLTIVRCALCSYMDNTMQCPSSSSIQDSQVIFPNFFTLNKVIYYCIQKLTAMQANSQN